MPEYRPIIKALSVHRKAGTVAETAPAILIRSGRSPAGSSPGHSPSFWLPMLDNTNSFNTAMEEMNNAELTVLLETLAKLVEATAKDAQDAARIIREAIPNK